MSNPTPQPKPTRLRYQHWLLFLILACVLFNVIVWYQTREPEEEKEVDEPSLPSFVGSSEKLTSTVIVPTLTTPLPDKRSIIWAATSNLAWKELHQLAGGDVSLDGLPDLSRQLNQGVNIKPDMEKADYYAAAGLKSQGIYDVVKRELAARFPGIAAPTPPDSSLDGILAYACFKIAMKYQIAFLNDEEPMVFRDGSGKKTKVKSFGIRKEGARYDTMRNQVGTFFHDGKGHYAVDISTTMQPYQVILACIEKQATLQQTLDHFDKAASVSKDTLSFGKDSILSVPTMEWSIDHRYQELIGKVAHGPRLPDAIQFQEALQRIEFRMDRKGVSISSSMRMDAILLNGDEVHRTGHYIFDQPYLIIVRKRKSADPLFVMWVENAELLKSWK